VFHIYYTGATVWRPEATRRTECGGPSEAKPQDVYNGETFPLPDAFFRPISCPGRESVGHGAYPQKQSVGFLAVGCMEIFESDRGEGGRAKTFFLTCRTDGWRMADMKHRDRITIRFSKEDIATIERNAKREKIPVSEWVRKAVTTNYMNHMDEVAIAAVQHKIAVSMKAVLEEHLPSAIVGKRKSA
jgi:hypothetical protein